MSSFKKDRVVCICNQVTQSNIEQAITKGCYSLDLIFDATGAGVGPCGGSCRPFLQKMISQYQKSKIFPQKAR
ncbi:MAG: (2Fe-2S)-binding protein [Bdellovibrionales bacterium]|nr:(2Fe-2S)-binding protein [Bdellovibrionales bacterium]